MRAHRSGSCDTPPGCPPTHSHLSQVAGLPHVHLWSNGSGGLPQPQLRAAFPLGPISWPSSPLLFLLSAQLRSPPRLTAPPPAEPPPALSPFSLRHLLPPVPACWPRGLFNLSSARAGTRLLSYRQSSAIGSLVNRNALPESQVPGSREDLQTLCPARPPLRSLMHHSLGAPATAGNTPKHSNKMSHLQRLHLLN